MSVKKVSTSNDTHLLNTYFKIFFFAKTLLSNLDFFVQKKLFCFLPYCWFVEMLINIS